MSMLIFLGASSPPVLSGLAAEATGSTTANVAATTSVDNGHWYWILTTVHATPSAAQVAAGLSQNGAAAKASGGADVDPSGFSLDDAATGLSGSTTYYPYAVQKDALGNFGSVVAGAAITTAAAADTTAPTLSSPTATPNYPGEVTIGFSTNEGNGTAYAVVTVSGTAPTATRVHDGKDYSGAAAAGTGTKTISGTGAKTIAIAGLTPGASYYAHITQYDAAGNKATVISTVQFTMPAAVDGSLVDTYHQDSGGSAFSDAAAFGDADADRVIAMAYGFTTYQSRMLNNVQIGGLSADLDESKKQQQTTDPDHYFAYAGIYSQALPSGTSGVAVINLSGLSQSQHGCNWGLYRLIGFNEVITAKKGDVSGALSVSVDVKAGDFVVIAAAFDVTVGGGAITLSGSGITTDIGQAAGTWGLAAAGHKAITAAATLTITASVDVSYYTGALVVVVYRNAA